MPVPHSVEVTWTLLFFAPAVVPWTFTETVQLVFGSSSAAQANGGRTGRQPSPCRRRFARLGGGTTSPAGKLSVKATHSGAVGLVLKRKRQEVVPFSGMVAAANAS